MSDVTDPQALASDGADVLPGVEPPTTAELDAAAEHNEYQQGLIIAAHLSEVDAWKAAQP